MGHNKQIDFLKNKYDQGGLGHAYIFSGQEGIGKKQAAKELIQFINCTSKEKPCQKCINCQLIEKEQFPDLMVVTSAQSDSSIKNEKDMMEIDVDQIRRVNNFLSLTSYYGGYKAVVIDQAERLNHEAQHCFLKTLEEPKGETLIILVSSKPEILLPTILSRCQSLVFFPEQSYVPSSEEQKILRELLPILNAELAVKFNFAKKANLEGNNMNLMLKVLQRYFRGLMLDNLGVSGKTSENQYSLEKLKNIITLIEKLHQQLSFTNASPKLALEILLMEI